ncbi:MAG: hypothetical protein AAFX06_08530 [Planctomycetota bacterium]
MSTNQQAVLESLATQYPWPEARPDFFPIHWSLDGGGRWMVEKKLRRKTFNVVLEIGSFLGGSIRNWLNASPDVTVVAVDPWPECDVANYARKHGRSEAEACQLEREDGFYKTFLSNLWEHRERVIPVRDYSPGILTELSAAGLRPDLIYLDSDKTGIEIELCHELFPGAVMTGDDWHWKNEAGEYPIREPVERFCAAHDRYLKNENATWLIDPEPPSFAFRLRTMRRAFKQRLKERRRQRVAA